MDEASRLIHATPDVIYAAFIEADALVKWMPPAGMVGALSLFEPRLGGRYAVVLAHPEGWGERGKAGDGFDIVEGQFGQFIPGVREERSGIFKSGYPAFAGTMRVTWTFTPKKGDTRVNVRCKDVPAGISGDDYDAGIRSFLQNLAVFVGRAA